MKKSKLLKNTFLIGLLCSGVNAFAEASYWPASFPELGSDYEFTRTSARVSMVDYPDCDSSDRTKWNPNYGTPIFKLSYNLILNVQNANDELRYDVYSKYDGKYIYKNIALKNGKNVIVILPTFLNHDNALKDASGDYVIRVKGIKYNRTYVNSSIKLNLSIKDSLERSRQSNKDDKYSNDGALFYKDAKLETKISVYRPAFTRVDPISPDSGLSSTIKIGDANPKAGFTCKTIYYGVTEPLYYSGNVARFYGSLDAYQIDMSGTMANYANPHMDTSSVAYFNDEMSYNLSKMLWVGK